MVLTSYALLLRDKDLLLSADGRATRRRRSRTRRRSSPAPPASSRPSTAGAVRHAHGEPPGRALVGVPLPDAGSWATARLPPRVPQPDREGGRRRPAAAARQPRAPVPAAPHQGAGGRRAAAQAGGPTDRAHRGPAHLYESVRLSMHKDPRRDRAARPRPQQHRDPGGPAQAAPGLLRPASAQERRRRQRVQRQVRAAHGHAAQHGRGGRASSSSRSSSRCST